MTPYLAARYLAARYLAERLVTLQKLVQRSQFLQRLGRKRPAHMLGDKFSEPLAQGTRLIRNLVELTWHRARLQFIQRVPWHKLGLSQPLQELIAAVEPIHRCIHRCRDGVQEIEAERGGDKNCRRFVFHDWPRRGSNRITGQATA